MRDVSVFISYSHHDLRSKDEFENYLNQLPEHYRPTVISDKDIEGGQDWNAEIETMLRSADIAVLLLCDEFLNSDYIADKELPILEERKRDEQDRLEVFPVLLRACEDPLPAWISDDIQIRPSPSLPLGSMEQRQAEAELTQIAHELGRLVYECARPEEQAWDPGKINPDNLAQHTDLEIALFHTDVNRYRAEMRLSHSVDAETNRLIPYEIALDPFKFPQQVENPEEYGKDLWRVLIEVESAALLGHGSETPRQMLDQAEDLSRKSDTGLHLRISVDRSAQELHHLRWELLRNPDDSRAVSALSDIRFSRYVVSSYGRDSKWHALRKKPFENERLSAVVFLPDSLPEERRQAEFRYAGWAIDPVDADIEMLAGSLESLVDRLNQTAVDVLYLACQCGSQEHRTYLKIPHGSDREDWLGRRDLIKALSPVLNLPRIAVLSPLEDALSCHADNTVDVWSGIAPVFAEAGVPAVLAAQCLLAPEQWQKFLRRFFGILRQVEDTDKAMGLVRRQMLKDKEMWWAPMLFTRLKTARIWYKPGFRLPNDEVADVWRSLRTALEKKSLLPVIGAGLVRDIAGSRHEIAQRWAFRTGFPLAIYDRTNLPRVAQFVSVYLGRHWMMDRLEEALVEMIKERHSQHVPELDQLDKSFELYEKVGRYLREQDGEGDPHRILASLPVPMYLTTVWNDNLADALADAPVSTADNGSRMTKRPLVRTFGEQAAVGMDGAAPAHRPWDEFASKSGTRGDPALNPTVDQPLVYHLFGQMRDLGNAKLTEDDFFTFLAEFPKKNNPLITHVQGRLAASSLIFLGFKIHQWDFRILFHTIGRQGGDAQRQHWEHVAVQIDPDDELTSDPKLAQKYLEKLFRTKQLHIYWGKPEDFLHELWDKWNNRN